MHGNRILISVDYVFLRIAYDSRFKMYSWRVFTFYFYYVLWDDGSWLLGNFYPYFIRLSQRNSHSIVIIFTSMFLLNFLWIKCVPFYFILNCPDRPIHRALRSGTGKTIFDLFIALSLFL